MSDPVTSDRLHALDAVRGFALLAGVAFHGCLSFIPGQPVWVVMDDSRSVFLSALFFVLHMFRMTVFFLIAGFFAHMSFHRRGAGGFILDRARRIALPLVVGWPILFSAFVACLIWAVLKSTHGHPPAGPAPAFPTLPAFPLTHLWFLWVLLLLYAAVLILRAPVALIDRKGTLRAGLDRVVVVVAGGVFAPMILAAPLAAVFAFSPSWLMWFGVSTPDQNLVPPPTAAVAFSLAFGLGWLIHRSPQVLAAWRRRWALNLAVAVAATGVALYLIGPTPVLEPEADPARRALFGAVYALAAWSWSCGLVGAALRFLHRESAARRYVADASYWIYLIHIPVVLALQIVVSDWPLPWFAKYPLVLAVAFVLLFASYHLLVRRSWIGAVLNGRRYPKAPRKARRGVSALEPHAPLP